MKWLFLIFICILAFNCFGPEAERFDATYQVKNESNSEVNLNLFNPITNDLTSIILLNNESYSGNKTIFSNGNSLSNPNNLLSSTSLATDSIIVFFNNERKKTHYLAGGDNLFSAPISRNLLRGGNYTNIGNDIYEIVLTEEDYNNAEDCGGSCE